jgi:DNA-binding NtrC family response regulator
VVVIVPSSGVESAVSALRAGASDCVAGPLRYEEIKYRVETLLELGRLRREVRRLRQGTPERPGFDEVVGRSPPFRAALDLVKRVLPAGGSTILVQGERGTGKDILARAVHEGSTRSAGPYLKISCTAIPEALLESQLFGSERGASADAGGPQKGILELAAGGTVLLDEVADLPLPLQSRLLRFLDEKAFRRLDGQRDIRVDVRVIAATSKDLKSLVEKGQFREDLYSRLVVFPVVLPPLRERTGDIPLLVEHFIGKYNRELGKNVKGLDPALVKRLEEYRWPGNVRELKNIIERAMILAAREHIDSEGLPPELLDGAAGGSSDGCFLQLPHGGINLEMLEKDLVCQALQLTSGNQTRAGRLLGLNRDQVRYRIEKFNLRAREKAGAE